MATATSLVIRQRVDKLPQGLQAHIDKHSTLPDYSSRELRRRATIAKELCEATGGEIHIQFDGSTYADDSDSHGHLYCGWASSKGAMFDSITLDDRQPDLRGQLAGELLRIAQEYLRLSELVDGYSPPSPPLPLFGERRFSWMPMASSDNDLHFSPDEFMTREEAIAKAASMGDEASQVVVVEFFVYCDKDTYAVIKPGEEAMLCVGCRIVEGGAE